MHARYSVCQGLLSIARWEPKTGNETNGNYMRLIHGIMIAALGSLGACATEGVEELEALEWRSGETGGTIIVPPTTPLETGGGRTGGGDWIMNGLADPSVSGLNPAFALSTPQGLNGSGWLDDVDKKGEEVLRYIVECALDEGDSISVSKNGTNNSKNKTLHGALGLAPEWKNGPCNESCQQWVSACLLARTNESGDEVEIFVEGDHATLGFGTEPSFPMYEGTFFGNVFTDPGSKYACRGSAEGVTAAEQQGRFCTLSPEECGITTFADCMEDAGCDAHAGDHIIDCQPDPAGPTYHAISVHVAAP